MVKKVTISWDKRGDEIGLVLNKKRKNGKRRHEQILKEWKD